MIPSRKLLLQLQNRLKVGTRRDVYLNAVPGSSLKKYDLAQLVHIRKELPQLFVNALTGQSKLKFTVSWKEAGRRIDPELGGVRALEQAQNGFVNLLHERESVQQERGINTLGFGFPLLVRRDKRDNVLTVAPVLIWTLKVNKGGEYLTWTVEREKDDPVVLNEVLMNHLKSDSGVSLDPLPEELLEKGFVNKDDVVDVCLQLLKKLNRSTDDDLKSLFRKNMDRVSAIPEKAYFEQFSMGPTDSMIVFGGLFGLFSMQKQSIIHDYEHLLRQAERRGRIELDSLVPEGFRFQPLTGVETDPSQQGILNSMRTTRNLLIQGPPGTGKSQTLTAILINSLENRRKTIVVCEKITALKVLHEAMAEWGLKEHCLLINDVTGGRQTVVGSVRKRVERMKRERKAEKRRISRPVVKTSLDRVIQRSRQLIELINKQHRMLSRVMVHELDWPNTVGQLLAELRQEEVGDGVGASVDVAARDRSGTGEVAESGAREGVATGAGVGSDTTVRKSYLDTLTEAGLEPGSLTFDSEELDQFLALVSKGQERFDAWKPHSGREVLNSAMLKGENPYEVELAVKTALAGYVRRFRGGKSDIQSILQKNHPDLMDLEKTGHPMFRLKALFSKEKRALLANQKRLLKLCEELAADMKRDGWLNVSFRGDTAEVLLGEIEEVLQNTQDFLSDPDDPFLAEFQWYQLVHSLSDDQRAVLDALKGRDNWKRAFLISYLNALLIRNATSDLPSGDLNHKELDKYLQSIGREQIRYIQEIWDQFQEDEIVRFEQNLDGLLVENLYNYRSGHRFKRQPLWKIVLYDTDFFTSFFPVILTTPEVCSTLFENCHEYFDAVLFDEASQLRVEDNLPAMMKGKQVIVAGDEHQMPPSDYFRKVVDDSMMGDSMMEEEYGAWDADPFYTLRGGIDESDGSIGNHDSSDSDDSSDSENNGAQRGQIRIDLDEVLLSSESMLEFSSELRFQKNYLDFHYRSRHPYLIDFSNHAFYGGRLVPLPATIDYNPITFYQVDGMYTGRTNEAEADRVLSILEHEIEPLPDGSYPSVGIATVNITQRNLIKNKIMQRQGSKEFEPFRQKLMGLEKAGLFVKNLENIQGDERDIIILSTTYGRGPKGRFVRNFGPINQKKGYKLLNVIVTRAKRKVYVCTSVPREEYEPFKEYLQAGAGRHGRAVFYGYLAYAKAVSEKREKQRRAILEALSGTVVRAGAEGDLRAGEVVRKAHNIHFEREVHAFLAGHFGVDAVTLQMDFAGYVIDVAYDPKIPGTPKIAIECDNATYHDSSEAYLYDLHRVKILEQHGFRVFRIWSTNWWRNPEAEKRRLLRFIEAPENKGILTS